MQPIDAVYTWVDGSGWKHRLRRMFRGGGNRFADHGELRFSLRALSANAPWIRDVYLVTDGSRPAWLKNHPRLKLINHAQIFADRRHLPSFNSRAIELHLADIPGLSDDFLYLNDDTFIGNPAQRSDFFSDDGKLMTLLSEHTVPGGPAGPEDDTAVAGLKNAAAVLDAAFGRSERKQTEHHPRPMRKALFRRFWEEFPAEASRTSASRFRSRSDVSFCWCAHPWFALHSGQGFEGSLTFGAYCIGDDEAQNAGGFTHLERTRPDLFCINDGTTKPLPATWAAMRAALKRMFPHPSPFER